MLFLLAGDMEVQLPLACQAAGACMGCPDHLHFWAHHRHFHLGNHHTAQASRDPQHYHGKPVCCLCHSPGDKPDQDWGEYCWTPALSQRHLQLACSMCRHELLPAAAFHELCQNAACMIMAKHQMAAATEARVYYGHCW